MMRVVATAGLLVFLGATAGGAERNLIPTLDNQPDVCPDQPPELQRIVEAQSCECPTRYPSWAAAERVYVERFASSEYWDIVEATSEYRQQANELRRAAMPICEAAGNW